jgi:single-strand DNA-binding protein
MNVVIIRGALSRAPEARSLPSGDSIAQFEVTVRDPDHPAESVPVVWFDPPTSAVRLSPGTEVVVAGRIRRRFFRTPAGTGSRTEVVATRVVPASQAKRAATLVAQACAALADPAP